MKIMLKEKKWYKITCPTSWLRKKITKDKIETSCRKIKEINLSSKKLEFFDGWEDIEFKDIIKIESVKEKVSNLREIEVEILGKEDLGK